MTTRSINVTTTGTYTVTVTNANGCSDSESTPVKVIPPAPTGLVANAVNATRIDLTWSSIAGAADSFRIERSRAGSVVTFSTTQTSFADTVPAGSAYVYRVYAVKSAIESAPSAPDLATAMIFTDDPLVAGSTLIRAIYFTDLREAVDAVRAAAGLSVATFTDPDLTGQLIKAVYIEELRSALSAARSSLGLGAVPFTDTPPLTGFLIKQVYVQELRGGVK